MTIVEVAEFLNVKESWLRSAVFRRLIPFIKLGNYIRFEQTEIIKWMENNKSIKTDCA